MTATRAQRKALKETECGAEYGPLRCTCHMGYVYVCLLNKHDTGRMHESVSVHVGQKIGLPFRWAEDSRNEK